MAKQETNRRTPMPTANALTEELSALREEVKALRESIAEFREVFTSAAHNSKLKSDGGGLESLSIPSPSVMADKNLQEPRATPNSSIATSQQDTAFEYRRKEYEFERLQLLRSIEPKRTAYLTEEFFMDAMKEFDDAFERELRYLDIKQRRGEYDEVSPPDYPKYK